MGRLLGYVWRGPPGLPAAQRAEWQLVPARWLAIVVVLLGLPWLPLSARESTSALVILAFATLFNLAVHQALHRRPDLLTFGYLTALGDTLLSLAMVELAGGFDSPFSSVFFVVGVSIAMRSSFKPALAMAILVIAAEAVSEPSALGSVAIRGVFLCLTVFFTSYLRSQAQRETLAKTAERKLAEEALRASEERFRKQYNGMPLPTYSWRQVDDDFVMQDFNDAAAAIAEGDVSRWVGVRASERYADDPQILADLHACVTDQLTIRREVHFRYPISGRARELALTYVFVPPCTVMLHNDDITERKHAEQQREAMAQSEKLRALGQMATGIAHDLNQSLMLVASYSELARQALIESPPDLVELESCLTTTTQAALDGGETVKRLLLFSRGAPDQDRKPVDLSTLIREAAQLTAPRWRDAAEAEGRRISLHVDSAGHPHIQGSPAQLRELMTNLIFNAVDALPSGGTIHLRVAAEDGQGIVEVADSGVGMTEEVQARVFEPFFTTKGESGTGLGMAMVFGIVEQHRGRIVVRSAPGSGTTIRITLPLLAAAVVADSSAPAAGQPARALRVLAVDDEPMMTRAVVRMLHASGHLVSVAGSGEEALVLLGQQPFDVIISDMGMGAGMNGWQLADEVKRRWPHVRFLLATGWGAAIDPTETRDRGVEAVLSKPYRLGDLVQALNQPQRAA